MLSSGFTYPIPYVVLTAFFLVCGFKQMRLNKAKSAFISRICIFIFLLFFGLRGFVGWDWHMYYPKFISAKPIWSTSWKILTDSGDLGFNIYMALIKTFTREYPVFIFINTLIDVIVINWVLKKYSISYGLSLAVFMYASLGTEIDLLRNIKAIELFLLAIPSIINRNPLKYFLLITFACLMHASAILYIPLYFFAVRKIPITIVIWLFIIGNIIFILQIPLVSPLIEKLTGFHWDNRIGLMMDGYSKSAIYSEAKGISPSFAVRFITFIIIIYYYNIIPKVRKGSIVFLNMWIIYMVVTLYFSDMKIIYDRVGNLFIISYWIILPAIYRCIKRKSNRRYYSFYLCTIIISFVAVSAKDIMYKYDNYLFGVDSFTTRELIFRKNALKLLQGSE